jgi:hypothetical protein
MDKKLGAVVLIAMVLMTTACASQGDLKFVKVTIENEVVTIGVYDQWWPNWMVGRDKRKLNFMKFGPPPTRREFNALEAAEVGCREFLRFAHPHRAITVGEAGVKFGITGFAGTALGSLAFEGANMLRYGIFGGTTSALFGGAYGTERVGMERYTFEGCGRKMIDHFQRLNMKVLLAAP